MRLDLEKPVLLMKSVVAYLMHFLPLYQLLQHSCHCEAATSSSWRPRFATGSLPYHPCKMCPLAHVPKLYGSTAMDVPTTSLPGSVAVCLLFRKVSSSRW